jgi:hypothetical protein
VFIFFMFLFVFVIQSKLFVDHSKSEAERLKRVSYLDNSELENMKEGSAATELDYFFKFICRHCGEIRFMMDLD